MALPSETSDTRQQFTWSHCYDMSLAVTAPCQAGVTSKTMCERQSCPASLQALAGPTTKTKRGENPPYENGVGTRVLLLLCIQWQVPVPQDLQHAKLSPQSALPFVWILLQGSPRGCYKSPVTPWTPSVMHMV